MFVRNARPGNSETQEGTNLFLCRDLKPRSLELEQRLKQAPEAIAMKRGPLILNQRTPAFEVLQLKRVQFYVNLVATGSR
jgi:hypothetical protein